MVIRIGGPGLYAHDVQNGSSTIDSFHHDDWDCLLRQFVDCDGQVCYQAWHRDCAARMALERYLVRLGSVDRHIEASPAAELAFHINAYNALCIWAILREYPTSSIQRHQLRSSPYRIFDDVQLWLGDAYWSLNGIEHEILRPMGDPRIHFALVCAAKSCPRLRNEAYSAEKLEWQFWDNATDFFRSSDRMRWCRATRTLRISPILKWFHEDFGQSDAELIARIEPYLPTKVRREMCGRCVRLAFLGYNWGLNDRCPTCGVWIGRIPYAAYAKAAPTVSILIPEAVRDRLMSFVRGASDEAPVNGSNFDDRSPSEPMEPEAAPEVDQPVPLDIQIIDPTETTE